MIELVPITQRAAKKWVAVVHRHLDYPQGDVIRTALHSDGELVAVGVAGRPPRMLQDGFTLEITRISSAAPVTDNACSRLYGALRRAAQNLGWRRFVTYTLPHEPGTSLRAAGFVDCGLTDGGEWDRTNRPRKKSENAEPKRRWMWPESAATQFIGRKSA